MPNIKRIARKALVITLFAVLFAALFTRFGNVSVIISLLPGASSLPKSSAGSVYDYYCLRTYSELGEDDSDVLIVNISNYPREVIGKAISRIDEAGAKVIGLDAVYEQEQPGDSANIIAPLCSVENVVIGISLERLSGKRDWNTPKGSYFAEDNSLDEAITNMYKEGRAIGTTYSVSGRQYPFFAWAVAQKYDPTLNEDLVKGQYINYGDYYYDPEHKPYDALRLIGDDEDYFEDFKEAAQGKIVLLGVISKNEDRHYLPSGDYVPGVLIHAYAVSSMIHRNYVKNLPVWLLWSLSALLCFLMTCYFLYLEAKPKKIFARLYKVLEIGLLFVLHFIGLIAFRDGLFLDLTCYFIIYAICQVLIFLTPDFDSLIPFKK